MTTAREEAREAVAALPDSEHWLEDIADTASDKWEPYLSRLVTAAGRVPLGRPEDGAEEIVEFVQALLNARRALGW